MIPACDTISLDARWAVCRLAGLKRESCSNRCHPVVTHCLSATMPLTPEQQFRKRAQKALEQGESFVARGDKNLAILEEIRAEVAARRKSVQSAASASKKKVEGLLNRRLRGKQKGKGDKGPGKGKDKGKDRQGPDKGKGESDDHHDDADDADANGWPSNPPILALSPFKAQVQKAVLPCEQMQADMARVLGKNSSAAALRAGDENEDDKEKDVMPDNSTGADSSGSLAKRPRKETNAPASASPCGCNEWFPRIVFVGMHSSGNPFCALCGSKWSF